MPGIHGGLLSDRDKKKEGKKVTRPRVHTRKGRKAAPSHEKLADDFEDVGSGCAT